MKEGSSNPRINQKTIRILGLCVLVGIVVYLLTRNVQGISVTVNDDYTSLLYSSEASFTINHKDILSVTERADLGLGKYISGIETEDIRFGVWENSEFGKYQLCINNNVERFIVIKTSSNISVFNFESIDATDSFYKALFELLKTK
jgi:hypothetical protein